ncbi:MAG: acetate--CoA ligase family protein, partial [Nocardioidaceae bacterium]
SYAKIQPALSPAIGSIAAHVILTVVALTVGDSPTGRSMVSAHSGAVAGDDAAWEALFSAYGVHRVRSLDELVDTLELFAIGRRVRPNTASAIATVHDSGGERALVADMAATLGVPFAELSPPTRERLTALLDPGLEPTNPLDVWGRGADTEGLFRECMSALADDDSVAAVVVSLDLVEEYDGDESYPLAVEAMLERTSKPIAVLSNAAAGIDQQQAARLRAAGVPVLEGTESGLRALRHLLDDSLVRPPRPSGAVDTSRRQRWRSWLAAADPDAAMALDVLRDYGLPTAQTCRASSREAAVDAAERVGYPVVLKTDEPGVDHKTDVAGVLLGLADSLAVAHAYDDLSDRLGGRVVVQPQHPAGVELALGVVRDPLLGPLVVVAAGGSLVELLEQRRVALPPLSETLAEELVDRLPVMSTLLAGVRGRPAANRAAVVQAIVAVSQLALELGDSLAALDVNPLICGPEGAVAVDALFVPYPSS